MTKCPRPSCGKDFPSKAAFLRHWKAGCCVPVGNARHHIACSVCSPSLRAIRDAVVGR